MAEIYWVGLTKPDTFLKFQASKSDKIRTHEAAGCFPMMENLQTSFSYTLYISHLCGGRSGLTRTADSRRRSSLRLVNKPKG